MGHSLGRKAFNPAFVRRPGSSPGSTVLELMRQVEFVILHILSHMLLSVLCADSPEWLRLGRCSRTMDRGFL